MCKYCGLLLSLIITASFPGYGGQISGPTTGTQNSTYSYSYTSSTVLSNPSWHPSGGTVMSQGSGGSPQSGYHYYASIKWTSTGTLSLMFANYSQQLGTLTVNVCSSSQAAGVTMAGPTSICDGSTAAFTATPTNGGTPSYEWTINGLTKQSGSSASYSTNQLVVNDVVAVTMTSSIVCLSPRTASASKTITTVTPRATVLATVSDPGPICNGASADFTASVTNGGSNPTYVWYRNGGEVSDNEIQGNTNVYRPHNTLQNGQTIKCYVTSNAGCVVAASVWSNTVTISTQSVTPSVSIVGNNVFCEGTAQTYTASSPQSISSYSWHYSGGLAWSGSSYPISGENLQYPGGTVQLTVTVSGNCLTTNQASTTLPITLYDSPQVGTLDINNAMFCTSGTVDLTLSSHVGNNSWQYRYKDGVNGTFNSFTEFSGSSSNAVSFSGLACGSVARYYEFRTQVGNGSCTPVTSNVRTVTVYPPSTIGTLSTTNGPDFCGAGTVNLSLTSYAGSLTWQYRVPADTSAWTTFSTTSSSTNSYALSNNGTSPRLYQFQVIARSGSCPSVSTLIVPASSNPYPGIPDPSGDMRTEPGIVNLQSNISSNATTNRWYDAASGGSLLATSQNYSPNVSVSTPFWVSSYNATIHCEGQRRFEPVYATVVPADPEVDPPYAELKMGGVTLTVMNGPYATYTWKRDGEIVGTSVSLDVIVPGTYLVQGTKTGMDGGGSTFVTVERSIDKQDTTMHFVLVNRIRADNVTDTAQIEGLTAAERTRSVTYFGGLGNALQTIRSQGSPLNKDIVATSKYDALGRQLIQYMPYVSAADDSRFRELALDNTGYTNSEQYAFFQQSGVKIATDTKPYTTTDVEPSPLQRVTSQTGVGDAWYAAGKKVSRQYLLNRATDNIRLWKIVSGLPVSSAAYGDYQLYATVTTDEDGKNVKAYVDKSGRLVQKNVESGPGTWLKTCNVYDDFGRLAYVLTPEGVRVMSGYAPGQTFLDSWAFQYRYDEYGRVVETKPPGAGWQYTVYDQLDRVVMTQSADQHTRNEWTFVKYDVLGRAIVTGYKVISGSRATIQGYVDGQSYNFEITNADTTGYSVNRTYPSATAADLLSVSYYDNYDFLGYSGWDAEAHSFSFVPELGNAATASLVTALPTGRKVRLVNNASPSSLWLNTVQYYDTESRPIQTIAENHLGGLDRTTGKYSFPARIDEVLTTHGGPVTITVDNKLSYDDAGRITKIYEKIDNAPSDQLVAQYEYNALGQLVDKKLHNTTGNAFLQSVDYRYTIRGWISSINNASLISDGGVSNDDTDDYFGMAMLYNTVESGLSNTANYNGNMSAVKWKGPGAVTGSNDRQSYKLTYDKADRLTAAASQMYSGTTWTKEANVKNESTTYDDNGNLKTLQRNQALHQLNGLIASYVPETIDNLTYTYKSSNGNQLDKVEDATGNAAGFSNNGVSSTNEFTYNADGSITADNNKGIDTIYYNMLGKPWQVLFTGAGNRKIEYSYSASGEKENMKFYQGDSVVQNIDYVGNFVYKNGALDFFGSPEGRVVKKGSNFEYQYAIADQQGNTRVVFSSATPAPDGPTATLENPATDRQSYLNVPDALPYWASFIAANHTPGGAKVVRMNQGFNIGPARSLKVYPGDKVDMEVWTYYENNTGFGTTSPPVSTFINNIALTFGGTSGAGGEAGAIYDGVAEALGAAGTGGNLGDTRPAAYLNYILYDRNYKFLNAGFTAVPTTALNSKQLISIPTVNIQHEGFIFVYLSYENESNNYVQFDDFKVTHTKTNVLQYNEYYPFGLQTASSWTREDASNRYLYNGGNELNDSTGWYETFFREYDPALGRFMQVDPLAGSFASMSPYQYGYNNPLLYNDVMGDTTARFGPGSGKYWSDADRYTNQDRDYFMMSGGDFEAKYKVSAVEYHDQLIFQRAVNEGEGWTGSIWDYTPWGSIHEYRFVDGKPTELTTYAYYLDGEEGIINHHVLAQTGNNDFQESIVDGFQSGLDAIGLIPVVGEIFDGANGLIYLARGDKLNAGLSFAATVPVLGWASAGTKLASKAHTVYTGIKNGKEYVGITVDLAKRYTAAQRAEMGIKALYENVPSRDLARGIEQTLINEKGLSNMANQINSISPANQLSIYSGIMQNAKIYMGIH